MSNKGNTKILTGVESSAASILSRAVEHDTQKRYAAALTCYQEGIKLLLDAMKEIKDDYKRGQFRQKVREYMDRAEVVKNIVQKEKETGTYHEQLQIEENSKGHAYDNIFCRFLDDTLTEVNIEDPYIRTSHQAYNFLRFCELLVKCCVNLKSVNLKTGIDDHDEANQKRRINLVAESLKDYNIILKVDYSSTLHDRSINLSNGWIIKIGRGLDYFKPTANTFSIGFCDLNLRPCHETTVDIFFKK